MGDGSRERGESGKRKVESGKASGQFRLNTKFFRPLGRNLEECVDERGGIVLPPLYSNELKHRLGEPRKRTAEITQREKDIAASCQSHFEAIVLRCLDWLHQQVPSENL